MRISVALIGFLCFVNAYSQDSTFIKLDALKKSYNTGDISFEEYKEESKKLLRPEKKPEEQSAEEAIAQFDTTTVPRTEEYCLIIGTGKLFSTKVTIEIDFGQKQKIYGDNRLRGTGGKLIEFESMVDALNFMNSKGWELYAAYPMTSNMGTAYHYLMKRRIHK